MSELDILYPNIFHWKKHLQPQPQSMGVIIESKKDFALQSFLFEVFLFKLL